MKQMLILLMMLILVSCNARHCIKIGGEYDGIDGSLEYCYDGAKTEELGIPAFSTDDGKTAILVSERQAKLVMLRKDNSLQISKYSAKQAFDAVLNRKGK